VLIFLIVVLIFAFIPYLGIALDSFGKGLGPHPHPVNYTLRYFERVAIGNAQVIINSLLYSGLTVIMLYCYRSSRGLDYGQNQSHREESVRFTDERSSWLFRDRNWHRLPTSFQGPLPILTPALIGLWIVIPLVLGVRRLPYTVRGTFCFSPHCS